MFKLGRKARQFNYTPLFYDQKKEEKEQRQRLNGIDIDSTSEEKYIPGSIIRKGRMKRMTISEEEKSIKSRATAIRLIVFIALLALATYFLITFTGFEIIVKSFRGE